MQALNPSNAAFNTPQPNSWKIWAKQNASRTNMLQAQTLIKKQRSEDSPSYRINMYLLLGCKCGTFCVHGVKNNIKGEGFLSVFHLFPSHRWRLTLKQTKTQIIVDLVHFYRLFSHHFVIPYLLNGYCVPPNVNHFLGW